MSFKNLQFRNNLTCQHCEKVFFFPNLSNSRCTSQVCPHCGWGQRAGFQVWRCSAAQSLNWCDFWAGGFWEGSRLDSFLCQEMINRSTPNEVHQLLTVWRGGEDREREEERGASVSCQCDSATVTVFSYQHTPLNFLPFPSPESFRSMLSNALQGCLVTTDHPDAFSLLGWKPYNKAKPPWIVMG